MCVVILTGEDRTFVSSFVGRFVVGARCPGGTAWVQYWRLAPSLLYLLQENLRGRDGDMLVIHRKRAMNAGTVCYRVIINIYESSSLRDIVVDIKWSWSNCSKHISKDFLHGKIT